MGKKTAAFLQLLRETGMRPGEAWALRWIDLDLESGTANVTPEKGGCARKPKLSNPLIAMLNQISRKSEHIFHTSKADPMDSLGDFTRNFEDMRKRIASKLENPRLLRISFKTLRR